MSLIERDEPESSSHGIALSSSRETDLKIKMYQEAYHHITGNSEKTSFRSTADLLIDFDERENRFSYVESQIPDDLKERVFVLGVQSNPESLRRDIKKKPSYESCVLTQPLTNPSR